MVASGYHFNHINLNLIIISIKRKRLRPIGVVEAREPVEFEGPLRIRDRVPKRLEGHNE